MKRRALARLERLRAEAERSPHNAVFAPNGRAPLGGRRLGLISASMPALSLLENLAESGRPVGLLKLGISHPLPRERVLGFLREHDEVLVVEETDRVLEREVKAVAWDASSAGTLGACHIHARRDPEDLMGELGPRRTAALLAQTWPAHFAPPVGAAPSAALQAALPPRIPQLCPGCGHRSAFHAIRKALPPEAITVGDIGCHSLGFFPPYEIGQVLLCMGHSTATGAGLSLGNSERPVLALMGDSTFFHAGMPGVVEAALHDHDLTLVLLDNGTTAMTGHQPNPGSRQRARRVPLEQALQGLGVRWLRTVDTYAQPKLTEAVSEALEHRGFSVVIARHPCMLQFVTQKRRQGAWRAHPVVIDAQRCEALRECVARFGCPSFVRGTGAAGDPAVGVHADLCIGDGSCLQTCPLQAIERPGRGAEGEGR